MKTRRAFFKLLAVPLALLLAATATAPPALADEAAPVEPQPPQPAVTAPASLAAAAAARMDALPAATLAQATQPAAPAAPDKPFFKTTQGIVALVLTAVGLGVMAYSFGNDRVESPGR